METIERRFGRSLPLQSVNVLLLMDMAYKHASIEQFEPIERVG